MTPDPIRGHLEGLLLAVLEQDPGHGYELARRVADRSEGRLSVPEGSLYPALHRLERGGLVTSSWGEASGRRRRVYQLTRSGRRATSDVRREWQAFAAAIGTVLGAAT